MAFWWGERPREPDFLSRKNKARFVSKLTRRHFRFLNQKLCFHLRLEYIHRLSG
jgi:hypothetical protein